MRSTWPALLALACACYSPRAQEGAPCEPATDVCPFPQTCQLSGGQYTCTTAAPDAPPLDARHVDAPHATDAPVSVIAAAQATANNSTGAFSTLAFSNEVQHGDAIIVCFTFPDEDGATALESIRDSLDNSYAVAVGPVTSNGYAHYIAIASDSAAGSDTVTVTLSVAVTDGWDLLGLEYTGLALTAPFDTDAYDSGDGTAMSSGSATTTSAHELLLGYGHSGGPVPGPGYTVRDSDGNSIVEDQVVFTTGNYSATATTASGIWTLILATFAGR